MHGPTRHKCQPRQNSPHGVKLLHGIKDHRTRAPATSFASVLALTRNCASAISLRIVCVSGRMPHAKSRCICGGIFAVSAQAHITRMHALHHPHFAYAARNRPETLNNLLTIAERHPDPNPNPTDTAHSINERACFCTCTNARRLCQNSELWCMLERTDGRVKCGGSSYNSASWRHCRLCVIVAIVMRRQALSPDLYACNRSSTKPQSIHTIICYTYT